MSNKIKSPVTIKVIDDQANVLVPLSFMFLGLVIALTLIFLVVA